MRAVDLIKEASLMVGDPKQDFHYEERMLFALNRATNRISTKSRSIHEQWHRPVVAGQYAYALPPGSLFIRKVKYKLGEWDDLERAHFSYVEASAAASGGGPPRCFSMWQNTVVEKTISPVVEVNGDSITLRTGMVESGLLVGDRVYNLTDAHSEGEISALGEQGPMESTFTVKMVRGGERDNFRIDDEVRVTSPHTKGHSILVAPSPVRTDEGGEESIAAFVARKHRVITATDIENENDYMELDDEFNDCLMYEVLHWSRVQRHGLDTTARLYRRLSNDEYLDAARLSESRIAQNLNAWEKRYGGRTDYRDVQVKNTSGSYNDHRVV